METSKTTPFIKILPNIISCFRIVGAFTLPFLIWENWEKEITLPFIDKTFSNVPIVWIIAYLILLSTDKLDGTLARKFKVESELGAGLDTIGDALTLVLGATLCFIHFVRENLETWQFWFYVGIMITCVICKLFAFILALIYHGKGNMIHTNFHKAFAIGAYIAIFFWAFLRTIPAWSIYSLLFIILYAAVDESIYCIRTAEYNVNFKGHGFETYKVRQKSKNGKNVLK